MPAAHEQINEANKLIADATAIMERVEHEHRQISQEEAERCQALIAQSEKLLGKPITLPPANGGTVVRAQSQPGGEVRLGFPSAHVHSHFTEEGLRYHHVDAVDPRQVHSRDAPQFAAEIEAGCILSWFCLLLLLLPLGIPLRWLVRYVIRQTGQVLLQLLVALGDPPLIGVVHL